MGKQYLHVYTESTYGLTVGLFKEVTCNLQVYNYHGFFFHYKRLTTHPYEHLYSMSTVEEISYMLNNEVLLAVLCSTNLTIRHILSNC